MMLLLRHKSVKETPRENESPLSWSAVQARNFVAILFLIMVGIKVALIVTERAIVLKPFDWLLIWPTMAFEHLIMVVLVFFVYLGLFLLSTKNRVLKYSMLSVVFALQAVLPFLYISSLKVAKTIGGFTTFEMTQADSEGAVFVHELLGKNNLPYTITGLVLSLTAVLVPWLALRRFNYWPRRLTLKITAIGVVAAIALGALSEQLIAGDIGVAASDPVLYYFSDMVEKKVVTLWLGASASESRYPTEPLFGDRSVKKTRKAFAGLDAWRKTRMNIILIVMESLPARQASFMGWVRTVRGEKRDTTPHIREAVKHGLLLKNHYSVHPTSMNALFSISCSLYPNPGGGIITRINPRIPCHSISEVLHDRGYVEGLFHSGKFSFWSKLRFFGRRGFSVMKDAKSMPGAREAHKFAWDIDEMVTAKAVVDFIAKNRNKSFFVEYIPVFPHAPYDAPPGPHAIFPDKKNINKYHNSIRYADKAIEIVIDGLKKYKLLDDTLLIFVGDHGEAFYEHPGNHVHSIYAYEENVHVAAAMSNPILFPKGRAIVDRVTSHIDFLPTLADLVGIPRKPIWHGHSLLEDGPSRPAYFYADWGPKIVGMRDGRYKVMWEMKKNTYEIYDIEKDPAERRNLKDQLKPRLKVYRSALHKWRSYNIGLIPNLGKDKKEKKKGD